MFMVADGDSKLAGYKIFICFNLQGLPLHQWQKTRLQVGTEYSSFNSLYILIYVTIMILLAWEILYLDFFIFCALK